MIINKEVLGELLLAAGHGKLTSYGAGHITRNKGVQASRRRGATAEDFEDFEIEVECEPVAIVERGKAFTPAEVILAVGEHYGLDGNIVTIDMREPNTHHGVTLETISHKTTDPKKAKKTRQLKRLGQLKGLTIESIKTVKQGTKAYIKTTDGAGICVEHAVVVQDLHPDENIALGLLTKEDLASIAKAKKMGLI